MNRPGFVVTRGLAIDPRAIGVVRYPGMERKQFSEEQNGFLNAGVH